MEVRIIYKSELNIELVLRDTAMQSVMDTMRVSLNTVKSLEVMDFLISIEHSFEDIFADGTISIEEIYEFAKTEDLFCIWQIEDISGNIYRPLGSPESTRVILDYLMVRIENNGSLCVFDKLFSYSEMDERW